MSVWHVGQSPRKISRKNVGQRRNLKNDKASVLLVARHIHVDGPPCLGIRNSQL